MLLLQGAIVVADAVHPHRPSHERVRSRSALS